MSLYYNPVLYGLNDVTIPENGGGTFGARIYYPSEEEEVRDVAVREGIYPLIAFAHGDRSFEPHLCPADRSEDYKKWGAVLHLLARCGFVVLSPAVHDVISDSERTAVRLETAIAWARKTWPHRRVLHRPPVFYMDPDVMTAQAMKAKQGSYSTGGRSFVLGAGVGFEVGAFLGPPTSLGLVGHSWGARAAARVAARGKVVQVKTIASIAGSWDENAAIQALIGAHVPTLMVAGTDDFLNASYLAGLWNSLAIPKHQAALQRIGHWDWFGPFGGIEPCDEQAPRPACPVAWQALSELLLAFSTKYLYNMWWRPPYLLGSPGGRPPFLDWFDPNGPCSLKVRWNDPTATGAQGPVGEVTLGNWTAQNPW
ncbi:hypothetical protein [Variovorax sp. DT-64]|uniref:hypothetical protein n=1 Tax=Variovorax sp. DT-64 TaxID=3396160 RepID=UPI003F1E346B